MDFLFFKLGILEKQGAGDVRDKAQAYLKQLVIHFLWEMKLNSCRVGGAVFVGQVKFAKVGVHLMVGGDDENQQGGKLTDAGIAGGLKLDSLGGGSFGAGTGKPFEGEQINEPTADYGLKGFAVGADAHVNLVVEFEGGQEGIDMAQGIGENGTEDKDYSKGGHLDKLENKMGIEETGDKFSEGNSEQWKLLKFLPGIGRKLLLLLNRSSTPSCSV